MTGHPAAPPEGYRPCVGIMLFNDRCEVFVGQRIDTPGDAWQMPQGGIDPGESPAEAALRELREETGTDKAAIVGESQRWLTYDLPRKLRRKVWGGRYVGQAQRWLALKFLGLDTDFDIASDHPEFAAWQWAPLDELATLIVPFKRAVYTAVIAELGPVVRSHARTGK